MKLLAIETSCDETAVAVLDATRAEDGSAQYVLLGDALISQIDIHREYGGVYPMVAKREHAKNLVPLLYKAMSEAGMLEERTAAIGEDVRTQITELLSREEGMAALLLDLCEKHEAPSLDAVCVTAGPGLEPALWVGVNFARALSILWKRPIVSVNHMEGHVRAALAQEEAVPSAGSNVTKKHLRIPNLHFPLLSLLISGGHTELVLSKKWGSYELVGATRDDAAGEAFDKVARMMGLPYPGGPEISKLAAKARAAGRPDTISLPRPMIHDPHFDFSFSGLKTSVLYKVKDLELANIEKEDMARAFEDAVADVLYAKASRALEETGAQTLAIGGGVSANTFIKQTFRTRLAKEFPEVQLCIPTPTLSTDNAVMIGLAGFAHAEKGEFTDVETLRADGNRKLRG